MSGNVIVMLVRSMAGGGAQQDAIEMAHGLAARGWPMVLATLDCAGPLLARIGRLPLIDLGQGGKLRMARAAPALRAMLAAHRPAAIIASEVAANCLVTAVALTMARPQRPLVLLREVAAPLMRDPYRQNRSARHLAPLLYPRADRVLSFTEGARRELVEHCAVSPDRAINLGSNAVLGATRLAELANERERERGHVIAVGRLSPEKDFATLIEAFVAVSGRLTILGEGPQRRALSALVEQLDLADRVSLPGRSPDPLEQVRRAALFVSSSRQEGFGNAIVEALACGTPVVATDVPHGPSEILAQGRYGTLVPPGDPRVLAQAINTALDAPVDRMALRQRAADYTTERASARFAQVLTGLGLTPNQPALAIPA